MINYANKKILRDRVKEQAMFDVYQPSCILQIKKTREEQKAEQKGNSRGKGAVHYNKISVLLA